MTSEILRRSEASAALICKCNEKQTRWLTRWNRSWQCYHFVGGHKHDDETFRQCLVREIREELALLLDRDFALAAEPRARAEFVTWSDSAQTETQYVIELFDVRLVNGSDSAFAGSDDGVRWLTEQEIRNKFCADGKPISSTMTRLLEEIGWKCPCDESQDTR